MVEKFKQIVWDDVVLRLIVAIILFYIVLVFLGWMAARVPLDAKFLAGALAMYLVLAFAFIINDIEDREDDAKSEFKRLTIWQTLRLISGTDGTKKPEEEQEKANGGISYKRFRNPFAYGIASVTSGYLILLGIAIIALALSYYAGGLPPIKFALSGLIVGVLYSAKPFRLKSRFPWDGISHAYLLAAVEILYFLSYPGASFDVWSGILLALAFTNSFAGDLRNEYRDFDEDQENGITNTATYLGKNNTYYLSLVLYILTIIFFVVGIVGAFLHR